MYTLGMKLQALLSRRAIQIIGAVYVLCWIIGLSSGAPSLGLDASGADITTAFAEHADPAALQYVFVEVLAGLAYIGLIVATALFLSKHKVAQNALKPFLLCGVAAGFLSVVMGILGVFLVSHAAIAGTEQAKSLFDEINRIDGPKMFLLSLAAASLAGLNYAWPKWFRILSYVLAAALLFSGVAYGLLLRSFAWSAYISGILLLVWAVSVGFALVPKPRKS